MTERPTPYIVELPDEPEVTPVDESKDQQKVELEEKDVKVGTLLL